MIKRLLALDGVEIVCRMRDDGSLLEGYGRCEPAQMQRLVRFAHDFRRLLQSQADQLSMFSAMRGWTPPRGWIVRGPERATCGVANVVCVLKLAEQPHWDELLVEMEEVSRW